MNAECEHMLVSSVVPCLPELSPCVLWWDEEEEEKEEDSLEDSRLTFVAIKS